jgi:ABC-type transport system involved in cytochrome bd biosynthesis fused ATPase/permease subunit
MIQAISSLLTAVASFLVASLFLVLCEVAFGSHSNMMVLVAIFTIVCFLAVSVKSFNPIYKFLIRKLS